MNYWFISIVYVISTCTATKILYVLPDNVSDVNCPSQPCATLGQYLLDNGSLPVLSDVEYYFLLGEHHVVNTINIEGAINLSLIGFGLSSARLVCQSQSHVSVIYSYNVTIRNLVFDQCSGHVAFKFHNIITGLLLYECLHCNVEDVCCFGYGFAGINLFLNSYINNITIDLTVIKPVAHMCSAKFSVIFIDTEHNYNCDSVSINKVDVSGYNEICCEHHKAMEILLHQSHYSMNVKLYNSYFYNINQIALHIEIYSTSSLLIKNCTFMYIKHRKNYVSQIVYGEISNSNVTLQLEDCAFYHNIAPIILEITLFSHDNLCIHSSNFTIQKCDFSDNNSSSLMLSNHNSYYCKPNIFFKENVNITKNIANYLMSCSHVSVNMNDVITVMENIVILNIIELQFCDITFYNAIVLLSNTICTSVIHLISHEFPYILILEYQDSR